jgi:hypothetical protein
MKERRIFIRKLGILTGLFAFTSPSRSAQASGRGTGAQVSGNPQGNFVHMVFFWLKQEDEATKRKFLVELMKFIDNVYMIKTRHIGTPADTDRDVIDNTYTYSLVLTFDSKKEHDLYQEHPLHKVFIENASSLWKKVQVYDSLKI